MVNYNEEAVASVFEASQSIESVLVTEDGNIFHTNSSGINFCKDHCNREGIKYQEVFRDGTHQVNDDSYETLDVKELKVLATNKGLEYAKNASKAQMIALLEESENFDANDDTLKEKVEDLSNASTNLENQ